MTLRNSAGLLALALLAPSLQACGNKPAKRDLNARPRAESNIVTARRFTGERDGRSGPFEFKWTSSARKTTITPSIRMTLLRKNDDLPGNFSTSDLQRRSRFRITFDSPDRYYSGEGEFDVVIPYSQLKPIIKPDCLFAEFVEQSYQ